MSTEQPKKSRRRWFQISLRTWLIALTVLIVWGGWWMQSAIRQKEVVARLRSVIVASDEDSTEGRPSTTQPTSSRQSRIPQSEPSKRLRETDWPDIEQQEAFALTQWVFSKGGKVEVRLLKNRLTTEVPSYDRLRDNPIEVTAVSFDKCSAIGDESVRVMGSMPTVEKLWLSGTAISDKSLEYVGQLTNLREL